MCLAISVTPPDFKQKSVSVCRRLLPTMFSPVGRPVSMDKITPNV